MGGYKFYLLFVVLFIATILPAYAFTITIEPEELAFEKVRNNGYAEQIITFTTDSDQPVDISLSAADRITSWMSFDPVSASVRSGSPAEFKVMVRPSDAMLGTYQSFLIINGLSTGDVFTTAISSAMLLNTTIEITDEEIVQATIKEVTIKDTEQHSPIEVSLTVHNQGNMAVNPFFRIDVLDSTKSQTLLSTISDKKSLLPSGTDVIELTVPNNLALGTYWADITVFLDDGWIIGKRVITFDILEKGTVPVEETTLVIKEEPVPLATGGIIILFWLLVSLYVVWLVVRNKPKKK